MKNKFTLIELLVVVAIIGILVSILMPSLTRAREKARRAVCMSNQAQLLRASTLYSNNNNGKLPAGHKHGNYPAWDNEDLRGLNPQMFNLLTSNYVGAEEVWTCPNISGFPRYSSHHDWYQLGVGYTGDKKKLNLIFGTEYPSTIYDDGDVPLFNELLSWGKNDSWGSTNASHTVNGYKFEWGADILPQSLGAEGGNYTFLDGHSKWVPINKLESYSGHSQTGSNEVLYLLPKGLW